MSDLAIEVQDLTKTFTLRDERRNTLKEGFVKGFGGKKRTFDAVKDVSFQVEKGKTFGLVGHNGSGKSTLLKMLAGVYLPTSGLIRVDGKVSALLELGAGFHRELTGRENIRLNGAILGLSNKQINEHMDSIVDFAELGDFIDMPVKQYSSGMFVRLGFAIAVMLEPEILIVDEVIAVGDEAFQRKSFDHIYKLRQQGTTIALVTHSMALARELCDEAIWLDGGVARAQGPIEDVVEQYISDVNKKEEAKLLAAPRSTLELPRRGTGEAVVEKVTVLDRDGEETLVVRSGEDHDIRLDLKARKPLCDVEIVVSVFMDSGIMLSSKSSLADGRSYEIPEGRSSVRLSLPAIPIESGSYWLSTSLRSRGHVWDHIDKGWKILVRSKSEMSETGPVNLRGDWSDVEVFDGAEPLGVASSSEDDTEVIEAEVIDEPEAIVEDLEVIDVETSEEGEVSDAEE